MPEFIVRISWNMRPVEAQSKVEAERMARLSPALSAHCAYQVDEIGVNVDANGWPLTTTKPVKVLA